MGSITTIVLRAFVPSCLCAFRVFAPDDAIQRALDAEAERIEHIQRLMPAVVCIHDEDHGGGGSGVLIDRHGYGLTNYHVVMGMMGSRKGLGGLSDGKLYKLEVLGIDVTGDVAMFRLKGRDDFPFAPLGDSSTIRTGDPVIAMGNPFTLAEDYTPTVTSGIVTGIHRYQGEGETLVYTDCIQTDAAINPGNSGGPLFNARGEVVGINGRISAEMHKYARGRYNVGLGYAIAIQQIKRFMPSLRAGLLAKHGTLLATVIDDNKEVIFNDLYEDAPGWNAGVRTGNRLLRFGDVDIGSANQFLNILGTYPENWPVPISFDSHGRTVHKVVRLEGVTPPMRHGYTVPDAVNRRALTETLEAFRKRVCGSRFPATPRSWSWTAVRSESDNKLSFRVTDARGRDAERIEGNANRRILSNDESANFIENGQEYTLGSEESLVYRAMYALRWLLLADEDLWTRAKARHAGADALVDIDASGHVIRRRLLETVSAQLAEDVTLLVGFELDTHLPARVLVRDEPRQLEVEIELDDYRNINGFTWPHKINIRSPKLRYDETMSDLRIEW